MTPDLQMAERLQHETEERRRIREKQLGKNGLRERKLRLKVVMKSVTLLKVKESD